MELCSGRGARSLAFLPSLDRSLMMASIKIQLRPGMCASLGSLGLLVQVSPWLQETKHKEEDLATPLSEDKQGVCVNAPGLVSRDSY